MTDFVRMKVLDACENLMEEPACFTVLKTLFLDDVIKEFTTRRVLHDEEELLGSLDYLIKLDNIRVTNDFQYLNFTHYSVDVCLVVDFFFFQYFDGDLLLCE